jgi:CubicO group peptidase (beta-lactamase class C family)
MPKAWALTAMLVLVPSAVPGPGAVAGTSPLSAPRLHRIEAEIARSMHDNEVPSYSVAILRGGDVVYSRSFGSLRLTTHQPATPDTLYNIGSVTKTFTAMLLMILRDAGTVALDDEVTEHLPDGLKMRRKRGIPTLLQLATHTGGMPRDAANRSKQGYGVQDLYKGLATARLERPTGKQWSYSNFGYDLLGHAMEHAAGESFEDLLKKHIFEPLGMRDSKIVLGDEDLDRFAAHYWIEDSQRTERPRWVWTEVAGSGGISTTLNDMTKYVGFMLEGGDAAGGPLSSSSLEEILGAPIAEGPDGQLTQRIAWMGFNTAEKGPWYIHGGEVDGHSAYVSFSPKLELGIVVLSNLGGKTASELGGWLERELHD